MKQTYTEMSKQNYNTLPSKICKRDAIYLLKTLRKELLSLESAKVRAVVWAYDRQGLTFQEIAEAMGYAGKQTPHIIYQKAKGGVTS